MLLSTTALLLLSILSITVHGADNVVKTESGEVQGITAKTLLNQRQFYSFRGIPYAQPPIGDLRFKAPVKVSPWTGVKSVSQYGSQCIQTSSPYNRSTFVGQEDCLFLNIFTPDLAPKEKLPVVFYIHGGGFMVGASNWLGPELLLDEDIVLVTINYRLGPFGFLTLNTTEYSGNMGLKDQLLALKWVNENIHHFGGDKTKITLFGHSAGAVSVNYHVLSPASRNLFQRAIMQGGSALNPWAYSSCNHTESLVKIVAKQKSKAEKDVTEGDIVSTLKTIDEAKLGLETFQPIYVPSSRSKAIMSYFSPTLENEKVADAFLNKSLDTYLSQQSNVDVLYGYTSAEALFFLSQEFNYPDTLKGFNENFSIQLPLVNLTYNCSSKEYKDHIKEVRQFYFGDKPVNKDTLGQLVNLLSDTWFNYGIQKSAKIQATRSSGKTYLNKFSVELGLNYLRPITNVSKLQVNGTAHIEDLLYLFKAEYLIPAGQKNNYTELKSDSKEANIIKIYRKFITNFVKFGNPTQNKEPVDLKPVQKDVINYADITNNGLVIGVSPDSKSIAFWDGFFTKHKDFFKASPLFIK